MVLQYVLTPNSTPWSDLESGCFSWPVPTNRNSASCSLVWKAAVSVGQYLPNRKSASCSLVWKAAVSVGQYVPTGILLHAVRYGRR